MNAPDLTPPALQNISGFLPLMTALDFHFTDGQDPLHQVAPGRYEVRGYNYDQLVWDLVKTAGQHGWIYSDETFQWTAWITDEEAQTLCATPAALAHAPPARASAYRLCLPGTVQ